MQGTLITRQFLNLHPLISETVQREREMGNYRFKFSDMIPNAWFYKLKDMNKSNNSVPSSTKKHPLPDVSDIPIQPNHSLTPASLPRKSYYFPRGDVSPKLSDHNRHLHPPQQSSKLTRPKRPFQASSASCIYRASVDSLSTATKTDSADTLLFESSPELRLDRMLTPETTTTLCDCGVSELVIHVDENLLRNKVHLQDMFHQLPPIVTKPVKLKNSDRIYSEKRATHKTSRKVMNRVPLHNKHNNIRSSSARKFSVHSPGKKIKIRSPKIQAQLARRMSTVQSRSTLSTRSLSQSFAIVKSSLDPQRDFRWVTLLIFLRDK